MDALYEKNIKFKREDDDYRYIIYALKNGIIHTVQQSIVGSILSMMLVLGCVFFPEVLPILIETGLDL